MSDAGWFEIQQFPHGITMIREPHQSEDVKSYLVEGEDVVAVIDTGTGAGDFPGLVASLSTRPARVLQSHSHWDHAGASHHIADVLVHPTEADWLRRGFPAQRYIAAFEPPAADPAFLPADFDPSHGLPGAEPTGWLNHGDMIDLGGRVLEVLHTPGHSAGGVSFLDREARAFLVADLLYLGAMYIFFPDSDPVAFRESLRLAAETAPAADIVYPAHGPSPLTPAHVQAIHEAYESIWDGSGPEGKAETFMGYEVTTYDFGDFSFLMPGGDWRHTSS